MKSIIKVTLAAAIVCASNTATAGAYSNLPLDQGNIWVFVEDNQGYLVEPTTVNTVEVTAGGYYGWGWYNHTLSGLFHADVELWDNNWYDELWTYSDQWYTAFDYGLNSGDSYSFRLGPCERYTATYNALAATLVAPAGDFSGAHGFVLEGGVDPNVKCAGPALGYVATADGVGPVGYVDAGKKGHLMYARVAGNVVAAGPNGVNAANGVELTMVLTDDTLQQGTLNCLVAPCPLAPAANLQAALVLTNTGNQTQTMHFTNGQTFQIDIRDGKGNVVRRWSDGRFFTQALMTIVLAPGENRVFYGVVPAATYDWSTGENSSLLYGNYTATGYINYGGSPKVDVPFNVQ